MSYCSKIYISGHFDAVVATSPLHIYEVVGLVKRTPIPSSFAIAVKGARRAFISTLDSVRERIQSATGTKLASFLSGRFSLSDFPTTASTKGSLVDNHKSQAFRPDPNIYPATTSTMINLFRLPLARERGTQSS
jgi:hypothetical protein